MKESLRLPRSELVEYLSSSLGELSLFSLGLWPEARTVWDLDLLCYRDCREFGELERML